MEECPNKLSPYSFDVANRQINTLEAVVFVRLELELEVVGREVVPDAAPVRGVFPHSQRYLTEGVLSVIAETQLVLPILPRRTIEFVRPKPHDSNRTAGLEAHKIPKLKKKA